MVSHLRPIKLAILGSTRGTTMQAIIDAITRQELAATIDVVVSNKADAPILERARHHGIEARFIDPKNKTREQFDTEVMALLQEKNIDLILLIGYMRFISKVFVQEWWQRVMNVHPSLLPAFASGMDLDVHRAVLASGVKETGCTIHFVDEGADTGQIIVQKKCLVESNDTPESLKARVQKLEGEAFIEAIHLFMQSKQDKQNKQ